MSRAEWAWLAVLSIGVVLLSSVAYITGYRTADDTLVFSGAVVDRMDYSVHLATMHLGERGEWSYRMRFTGEQQQGAYVKLGYIFLGHAARWLGIGLTASYHLGRIILGLLVCVLVYALTTRVFDEPGWRRLAWLMAVCGGGLGWLQSVAGWVPQPDLSPVDFWLVDAYTYFSLTAFPHFLAVITLVQVVILIGLEYLVRPARWHWAASAAAVILMQFIQPFAPAVANLALLGAFSLHGLQNPGRRLRSGLYLVSLGLVQLPVFLYNLTAFWTDSTWASFTYQNVTLSPPPVYYVWGFAPFWLPALAGALWLAERLWAAYKRAHSQISARERITHLAVAAALAWTVGAMLLAYAPTNLQRRFLLAYTIPLGLLAASGLRYVFLPWVMKRGAAWLRARPMLAPVCVTALTCIYAPVLSLGHSSYVATRPAELFDPAAWVRAVDWLDGHAEADDLVLAGEQLSRLIAARAGLPVFSGHPMETLHYEVKSRQVIDYFSGNLSDAWLFHSGVRWVVFSAEDQIRDEKGDRLELAFDQDGVKIYKVLP